MISLEHIKPNLTVVTIEELEFYFSYKTLVAMFNYVQAEGWYTNLRFSTTTSKHMGIVKLQHNKWSPVPQEELENLASGFFK